MVMQLGARNHFSSVDLACQRPRAEFQMKFTLSSFFFTLMFPFCFCLVDMIFQTFISWIQCSDLGDYTRVQRKVIAWFVYIISGKYTSVYCIGFIWPDIVHAIRKGRKWDDTHEANVQVTPCQLLTKHQRSLDLTLKMNLHSFVLQHNHFWISFWSS